MKRIVIYALLLLILVVVVVAWVSGRNKGPAVTSLTKDLYLVAEAPLQAGKFLPVNGVTWKTLDDEAAANLNPDSLIRKNKANDDMLNGVVLLQSVSKGDYVKQDAIISPSNKEFLPTVLSPGFRAVAISVNDVTGGAGLFRPGNIVDVILTMEGDKRNKSMPAMAKTLLRGVRILAVNKDLGLSGDTDAEKRKRSGDTVTLEVVPRDAEVMALASKMGELSLSLCSSSSLSMAAQGPGITRTSDIVAAPKGVEKTPVSRINTLFGTSRTSEVAE